MEKSSEVELDSSKIDKADKKMDGVESSESKNITHDLDDFVTTKKHIKSHHKSLKFDCQQCDYLLADNIFLSRHKASDHEVLIIDSKETTLIKSLKSNRGVTYKVNE